MKVAGIISLSVSAAEAGNVGTCEGSGRRGVNQPRTSVCCRPRISRLRRPFVRWVALSSWLVVLSGLLDGIGAQEPAQERLTTEVLSSVSDSATSPVASELPQLKLAECQFVDAFGKSTQLSLDADASAHVLLLISTQCPLARLYMQRCQELAADAELHSVSWHIVSVVPQDGTTDLQLFAKELQLQWPLLKELTGTLHQQLAVERVPTAVVLNGKQEVVYLGRVDNQYEVGVRRDKATEFELRAALQATLAGKAPVVSRSEAPGCLIPTKRTTQAEATVTFNGDIAAIFDRRCNACHRPNDIGPMSFLDGVVAAGWADMILEVIDEGRMPPWNATDPAGTFHNENRLTEEETRLITTWVEQGAAVGDPSIRPSIPSFSDAWRLSTDPDSVIELPLGGFRVPAAGTVDYQYFVVDPGWTEDKWIRAAQLLPGDPAVVHHAIAFIRSPETTRFDGLGILAGFVPGQEPTQYPEGQARRVPAGSKIVFQMHYTPSGVETTDISRVGLWFADESEVRWEVVTGMLVDSSFEIPSQASQFKVSLNQSRWPRGAKLLSVAPHMHVRGDSIQVDLATAEGRRRLLTVPRYDFNWQHTYKFAEPIDLANDSALEVLMTFDNSSANIANPGPERSVRWGEQTWEEMAVLFLDIALPRQKQAEESRQSSGSGRSNQRTALEDFIKRFDADGDGQVERSEVPEALGAFAFDRLDKNSDDRIDHLDISEQTP